MKKICLMALLTIGLLACNNKKDQNNEVEYLPYQEEKDGNWGLISPGGEVLFTDEFKNEPTLAVNGRFMVKNSEGLWEIYTTEKKPRKIGGEYLQASLFYEDVTPVVEKGEPIKFIDKDGNVTVTLDKINGKAVTECTCFYNGLARVKINGFYGAVDKKGKLAIEPHYTYLTLDEDGRAIGLNMKYEGKEWTDRVFSVMNYKGEEIGTLKGSKIDGIHIVNKSYRQSTNFVGDGMLVAVKKEDKTIEGIIGLDGEWILKPTEKRMTYKEMRGNLLTYANGEEYGMTNVKGENIIRPKFKSLYFLDEKTLSGKKAKENGYSLYDLEGNKISKDEYEVIFTFHSNEEYTIARIGEGDYVLLDRKGNEKKLEPEVYFIGNGVAPDFRLESDYADLDDIISTLNIKKDGFLGLTMGLQGHQAIQHLNNLPGAQHSFKTDPKQYSSYTYLWEKVKMQKLMPIVEADIKGLINSNQTRNGWWTTTNYTWSDKTVPSFDIYFDLKDNTQLEGKMQDLYNKIRTGIKQVGTEVKSGKNAIVIETEIGIYYYAYWSGTRVALYYGSYDPNSLNVDEYDNSSEEVIGRNIQPGIVAPRNSNFSSDDEVSTDSIYI